MNRLCIDGTKKSKEFLDGVHDGDNHRPLLLLALEITEISKNPVAEFGAGTGSTPYLRKFCEDASREFVSFDSNKEWAEKWGSEYIESWRDEKLYKPYSVVLIDQAPGEYRHESMIKLKDDAEIIVVHDAEPEPKHGYRLEEIWHLFKYRVFVKGDKIWAAAVSNSIDLTQYVDTEFDGYKIEL